MILSSVFITSLFLGSLSQEKLNTIQSILKPLGKQVGFSLRDEGGKEILGLNQNQLFPPASVAKMISSACSLWALGPAYQFETGFGYTGQIVGDVLEGDWVVQGSGDPSFVIEDLKEVLEKIRVFYGLRKIKGNLVFDVHYFGKKELEWEEGFDGDEGRSFHARLTATPINHNSFSLWIIPRLQKPAITLLPHDGIELAVENKLKTGKSWAPIDFNYQINQKKIIVSGNISPTSSVKSYYRAVPDPYDYFRRLIKRIWKELGGESHLEKYKLSMVPLVIKTLWTHSSRPVSRLLLDINKLSTNFGSEMIFLAAAAHRLGKPATQAKAQQFMNQCLKYFEKSSATLHLQNASGLSRESKVEPSSFTHFLFQMLSQSFTPEYLSSFSILGMDGTTKSRLHHLQGKARLKTGSIQGVRTLTGFLYPEPAKPLLLGLFFQCPTCSEAALLEKENKILEVILK